MSTLVPLASTNTTITDRLIEHAEAARGAYAANTEQTIRADVATFTGWCAAANRQALPASF